MNYKSCFSVSLFSLLTVFSTFWEKNQIIHAETLGTVSCYGATNLVRWFDQKLFQQDIHSFLQNQSYILLQDQNHRFLLVFLPYAKKDPNGRCLENRFFLKEGDNFYQLSQEYAGNIDDVNFLLNPHDAKRKDVSESRIQGANRSTALFWRSLEPGKESLEGRCCIQEKKGSEQCLGSGVLFSAVPQVEQKQILKQAKMIPLPPIPKPIALFSFLEQDQEKYMYVDLFDPDERLAIPGNIRIFIGSLEDLKPQEIVKTFPNKQKDLVLQTHSGNTLTLPEEYRYPIEFSLEKRKGTPTWTKRKQQFLLKEIKLNANVSQKLSILKRYPETYQNQFLDLCGM